MDYATLPQRLLEALDKLHSPRAQIYQDARTSAARWREIPAQEMLRRIAGLSASLAAFGIRDGDRMALFAPNCPEWHIADFAAHGTGAVVVPVYFRESPERIEYILRHSEAKAVFVAGADQVRRLYQTLEAAAGRGEPLDGIEHIVTACDPEQLPYSANDALDYQGLIARAGDAEIAAYRRRAAELAAQPPGSQRLASIIYTSGTTGEPKGVMLSHANFVSNEIASFEGFPYGPEDVALSFLPLAHVYERTADYGYLFRGIPVAYVEQPENVAQALLQVRPTIAAAVPRFFEKLYDTVMERGARATGLRRSLFRWAVATARKSIPWRAYGKSASPWLRLEWRLADRLVYAKFRAGVGGRLRYFVSGGAPLARELAEFFTAVGLPIYQGYGLTETSPVVSWNKVGANRIGTVGRPVPGVDVKIALEPGSAEPGAAQSRDGEVLVHGPCVMLGYYKRPEETRAAISPDGWFATGDIGYLDDAGYLVITDRKKELLKTAGGKFVAPAPIENALKASPYIASAALVGDRRRFVAALIVPDFDKVEGLAAAAGIRFSSRAELIAHPWTQKLIEDEVARVNARLAQYETIKRFALLDHDFTFDGGELTYTLKLKRRVIEQRYAGAIESLYAEPSPARP